MQVEKVTSIRSVVMESVNVGGSRVSWIILGDRAWISMIWE